MATKTTGLHRRPTYHELIEEIQRDEKIKLPNRDAIFLRNSPYMSFLDGQGTAEMQNQQDRKQMEVEAEHVLTERATAQNVGVAELRAHRNMENTSRKVETMLGGTGTFPNEPMGDVATGSGITVDDFAFGPWAKGLGKGKHGDQPRPLQTVEPQTVQSGPVHVDNRVTQHIHLDQRVTHLLTAEAVQQEVKKTQVERLVAKIEQDELMHHQKNDPVVTLMDTTGVTERVKREAGEEQAKVTRSKVEPLPPRTPAPVPTIQPMPNPTLQEKVVIPAPIVQPDPIAVKRPAPETQPEPKAKAKAIPASVKEESILKGVDRIHAFAELEKELREEKKQVDKERKDKDKTEESNRIAVARIHHVADLEKELREASEKKGMPKQVEYNPVEPAKPAVKEKAPPTQNEKGAKKPKQTDPGPDRVEPAPIEVDIPKPPNKKQLTAIMEGGLKAIIPGEKRGTAETEGEAPPTQNEKGTKKPKPLSPVEKVIDKMVSVLKPASRATPNTMETLKGMIKHIPPEAQALFKTMYPAKPLAIKDENDPTILEHLKRVFTTISPTNYAVTADVLNTLFKMNEEATVEKRDKIMAIMNHLPEETAKVTAKKATDTVKKSQFDKTHTPSARKAPGDTKKDNNPSPAYWRKQPLGYLKDQLESHRNIKFPEDAFKGKNAYNRKDLVTFLQSVDKIGRFAVA